jgi:hypothetical protein
MKMAGADQKESRLIAVDHAVSHDQRRRRTRQERHGPLQAHYVPRAGSGEIWATNPSVPVMFRMLDRSH